MLNYKNILDEIVKGEWHFIGKRHGAPPLPVWNKFPPFLGQVAERLYSTIIPWLVVWEGNFGSFYVRSLEYKKSIKSITDLLFDAPRAKKHIARVFLFCSLARREAGKFYKKDLTSINESKLFTQYKKIIKVYQLAFAQGYISWCSQILQKRMLDLLARNGKSLASLGLDEKSTFGILALSPCETMYNKKEAALNNLSRKYKSQLVKISEFNQENIAARLPSLHVAASNFLKKYDWVGYDYGGPIISYEEVIAAIRDRQPSLSAKHPTKAEIYKACNFTKSEKNMYEVFSLLAYVKDSRNVADDFAHFCLDNFFTEIGKRHSMSKTQVRYLWPKELEQLIKYNKKFNPTYLKQKLEYALALIDSSGEHFYVGKEAKARAKLLLGEENNNEEDAIIISGSSASPGKIQGVVKIIESFDQLDKLKGGEILVTSMTSPRFMAGIIKAGAIITDEGGLTCHAAIIARELKKTCIVGTKIATKVLKDGDLVEVDADKGIVRIIKRDKV